MEKLSFIQKVSRIQAALKVPKKHRNNFGNYNYRNCEDILEALKPKLVKYDLLQVISDVIEVVGERVYIKSTVKVMGSGDGEVIECTAYAREPVIKKGMDEPQITGTSSSYARKYALNGMWMIDDTRDADSDMLNTDESIDYVKKINSCTTVGELAKFWSSIPKPFQVKVKSAKDKKKKELEELKEVA